MGDGLDVDADHRDLSHRVTLVHGTRGREPRVVDEQVDREATFGNIGGDTRPGLLLGQIGGDSLGADSVGGRELVGQRAQPVLAPSNQRDAEASPGEASRDIGADAGRSTGHDTRPVRGRKREGHAWRLGAHRPGRSARTRRETNRPRGLAVGSHLCEREGVAAPFRFDRTWVFRVAPVEFFATITRTECFTDWWSWLRRCEVDGVRAGAEASCLIRAPLPYSLRFIVRIDRVEPDALIETSVRGDLAGPARLEIAPHPEGCRARLVWSLELHDPVLRRLAVVSRPAMVWAHDRIVAVGAAEFERKAASGSLGPVTS